VCPIIKALILLIFTTRAGRKIIENLSLTPTNSLINPHALAVRERSNSKINGNELEINLNRFPNHVSIEPDKRAVLVGSFSYYDDFIFAPSQQQLPNVCCKSVEL